jgi:hypothetical protein
MQARPPELDAIRRDQTIAKLAAAQPGLRREVAHRAVATDALHQLDASVLPRPESEDVRVCPAELGARDAKQPLEALVDVDDPSGLEIGHRDGVGYDVKDLAEQLGRLRRRELRRGTLALGLHDPLFARTKGLFGVVGEGFRHSMK